MSKFVILWPMNNDFTDDEVESLRTAAIDDWHHALRKAGGESTSEPVAFLDRAVFPMFTEDGTELPRRAWRVEGEATQ